MIPVKKINSKSVYAGERREMVGGGDETTENMTHTEGIYITYVLFSHAI